MRGAVFATLWLALCCAGKAQAADIRYDGLGCRLVIEGHIEKGDDAVFYDKILEGWNEGASCHVFDVMIASPGGNLAAAMMIGRQVRAIHAITNVPLPPTERYPNCYGIREKKNCVCASACFFIWAAGSERSGEGIYIHRPYFDPARQSNLSENTSDVYGETVRRSRSYLADMDIPTSITDRMFATKSTEGSPLTAAELDQLDRAPYFDEFIIAKCGPLPSPETFATRQRLGRPLKSMAKEERERITKLTKDYFNCHRDVHEELARASFKRFVKTFEPIYGKEVAERHRRRLEATPGYVFRGCPECPEMVVVPAGSHMMGSPEGEEGRSSDEGPQHTVTIARPFAVGIYEVTFAEWDACVSADGCKHNPDDQGWGRGNRPVINVSWDDITKEYLPWLSRRTGKAYRLLTEAEWEYAARADTNTRFEFGDDERDLCTNANVAGSTIASCRHEHRTSAPVGSFLPNSFRLHDMHGNVREWVQDCWNGSYQGAPTDGSAWETGHCGLRVLRGGSWYSGPKGLRSASRYRDSSVVRGSGFGFRVARTLDP